ncbi:CapA family protein [Nocardioides sp. 1609]|uniref:CapA family protein n=1 Tax=Nocardioides sp. 1609 TaxID=2508327 RepID=UPI00107003B5|nr:CapA family protein [Nocardioides sp. 1609]
MDLTLVGDVVVSRWPRRPEGAAPGDSAIGMLAGKGLVIGNLEAPLTSGGERAEKLVALRTPVEGANELADMGFDLVSLATNHALDYGADGMRDTVRALDAAGIAHAGFGETRTEALSPAVVEVDGKTLAYFSVCSALPLGFNATATRAGIGAIRVRQQFEFDTGFLEETPGTPPYVHSEAHEPDVVAVEEAIRRARKDHDAVAVAIHWGVPFPYLPEAQGPLAEYQRPLAHRLIDAGADLIVGHHPHCLHPVEFYGRGLILYSTGNFVFDWCDGWSPESMVAAVDAHPYAPYRPVLVRGQWFESAVFRVGLRHGLAPSLRVEPIELDADSQPVRPDPTVGRSILRGLQRVSREIDPTVSIGDDGVVTQGRNSELRP